jgi:hypothetical protein
MNLILINIRILVIEPFIFQSQDMPYLLQVKKGTLSSYRNCLCGLLSLTVCLWKLTDSVCNLTHLTIGQIIGIFQKVSGQDALYLLQVKKGTLSSYRNCLCGLLSLTVCLWKLTNSVCDLTHLTISQIIGILKGFRSRCAYLLQVK